MIRYSILIVYFTVIEFAKGQFLDEKCELQSKTEGICKLISQCPSVIQDIPKGVKPTLCGFQGIEPIVCCPSDVPLLENPLKVGIKSKEKCDAYKKKLRKPQLGIINGLPSTAGEFPHMVALGFGEESNPTWLCGGTLISEKFVLTAGHCLQSPSEGPVKFALAGTTNLQEHYQGGNPQLFSVVKTYPHPEFKPPSTYNDIALLELNDTATITPYVIPACINTDPHVSKGQAIGWGRVKFAENTSDHLLKVDLKIYDFDYCNKTYSNVGKRILRIGILKESQICAGGDIDESKDTCQGDSGGPLHIPTERKKIFTIIGITSFGKGCGIVNVPGVYTRVSHFVDWIENIVWR